MSKTYSNTSASSLAAKLRRLKIEENIILQNIIKSASACSRHSTDIEVGQTSYLTLSEFNKFSAETKNSYNELKQAFQDIKANTSSKEMIKSLDIEEIKNSTHELESNIKSFKLYLHTEIIALKSAEQKLNQELNDPISMNYSKRMPRMQTAKYTEIVPSPVKTLMTSPFKCIEVQEFQEFMKNSKNRYGGWNEYHHNIFINLFEKYLDVDSRTDTNEGVLKNIEKSTEFQSFLRELTPKLLGVSEEEIKLHVKWYTMYLHFKNRQQKAIDKWRANRRMMIPSNVNKEITKDRQVTTIKKAKRVQRDDLNNIMDYLSQDHIQPKGKTCNFTRKCLSDEMGLEYNNSLDEDYEDDIKPSLHFLKSTKQWNIRCSSKNNMSKTEVNNVENIKKLGTPLWRVGL